MVHRTGCVNTLLLQVTVLSGQFTFPVRELCW